MLLIWVILAKTMNALVSSVVYRQKQKRALLNVIAPVAYWSYDQSKLSKVPDSNLIEAVLIYGNDPLRRRLFNIFPSKKIKSVWEKEIVIRGQRFDHLNKKIAADFLHIANPEKYIEIAYSKYNLYDRFSSSHS